MCHLAKLARETDLTEHDKVGGERPVDQCADERETQCKIGTGFGEPDTPDGGREHLLRAEFNI